MNRTKVRMMVGEHAYNGAKHIYKNDDIQNFTVNEDGFYDTIEAITHDKSNQQNTVKLIFNRRRDGVINYFCDCDDYQPGYTLCQHCTAVLLKHMDYMNEQDAIAQKEKEDEEKSGIEQTPEPLKQILIQRQVRRLVPFSEVEKYGRVCLTPHLTINSEGFKLEFKIGIPDFKMYILKDIILLNGCGIIKEIINIIELQIYPSTIK